MSSPSGTTVLTKKSSYWKDTSRDLYGHCHKALESHNARELATGLWRNGVEGAEDDYNSGKLSGPDRATIMFWGFDRASTALGNLLTELSEEGLHALDAKLVEELKSKATEDLKALHDFYLGPDAEAGSSAGIESTSSIRDFEQRGALKRASRRSFDKLNKAIMLRSLRIATDCAAGIISIQDARHPLTDEELKLKWAAMESEKSKA